MTMNAAQILEHAHGVTWSRFLDALIDHAPIITDPIVLMRAEFIGLLENRSMAEIIDIGLAIVDPETFDVAGELVPVDLIESHTLQLVTA